MLYLKWRDKNIVIIFKINRIFSYFYNQYYDPIVRMYSRMDGSVIEFRSVRATYRIYCPANDEVIPETLAPSRENCEYNNS